MAAIVGELRKLCRAIRAAGIAGRVELRIDSEGEGRRLELAVIRELGSAFLDSHSSSADPSVPRLFTAPDRAGFELEGVLFTWPAPGGGGGR